jgi:hypothetical protein
MEHGLAFTGRAGTIPFMAVPDKYGPEVNRLGLVISTVLLALSLTRIIPSPGFNFELQLPGFLLSFPFSTNTVMGVLTAC